MLHCCKCERTRGEERSWGEWLGARESGWLLEALTAMLRCHTVQALCDLAYDALRVASATIAPDCC